MARTTAPNRREFLVSAVAAASAGSPGTAAQAPGQYCIDCQSHIFVPEAVALMRKRKDPPRIFRDGENWFLQVKDWVRAWKPEYAVLDAKIAAKDKAGIDFTILSTNDPGPELFGNDGPAVARMMNDYLAEVARKHPKRFAALAVLPLQDMDAAMKELDRCVSRLGMKGIILYSNLNGAFPDEPQFRPLFRTAEAMRVPILLHPPYPVTFEATKGYALTGGLGLMFDTTIALCRIIMAGILEDHPDLQLVCPHVGGTLPYLIGRVDHQTLVMKRVPTKIKKAPSDYLRRVWLDVVAPIPMAIRYAYDFVGPDRLLYSSDHPWVQHQVIIEKVKSLRLPAQDETKLFSGNAKRLFRL